LTIRAKVNKTAVVTVDVPNVATFTHTTHSKTLTENSNIVYVRIMGQKTLPDTGASPIPLVEQPWFLYILSFTLGLVLFAFGLVSCILSDRLAKSSKAVKKNRMILQRVFGMAGMIIGGTILGLFLVSFVVTQVVVPGSPPQLGSEVAGGEEEMITELLPSGERLVIISNQAPIAEDLPDYEQPVWEVISEESPGLGEFSEPLIEKIDATAIRRIIIPSLNVNERVDFIPFDGQTWPLAGIREQVAWLGDTSAPGLGSNTVLAGHVTLTGGSVGPFHQLNRLQNGDKIIILTDENSYTYVYQSTLVVDRTDMYVTEATQDPQLTLITCTSWDADAYTYLQRLVVMATLESIAPHTGG
jgi:LPXTG-site transpeptidase (sortase) family protein